MKHLDLFSGIGGAAYAVDSVWPNAEHTFVEIDPYCQAVLRKHWPNSKIYGDIRTLRFDTYSDGDGRTNGKEEINPTERREQTLNDPEGRIDLLTGGFPCQPFSQAGRRKGTSDNRFLWPEMLRVIREFRPRWVVGENVAGLLTIEQGVVFEQICLDLEKEGYEVQPFVIPAVAVNAPHRRDRVWIVANARRGSFSRERKGRTDACGTDKDASNTRQSYGAGSSEKVETNKTERSARKFSTERSDIWNRNWVEVAAELCGVDDGLPAELDGLKLSKSKHRAERLKGLGNAWVPQVAAEIFAALSEITKLLEQYQEK